MLPSALHFVANLKMAFSDFSGSNTPCSSTCVGSRYKRNRPSTDVYDDKNVPRNRYPIAVDVVSGSAAPNPGEVDDLISIGDVRREVGSCVPGRDVERQSDRSLRPIVNGESACWPWPCRSPLLESQLVSESASLHVLVVFLYPEGVH